MRTAAPLLLLLTALPAAAGTAERTVYVTSTASGLPLYSSEPVHAGSRSYLVLGEPPPRPLRATAPAAPRPATTGVHQLATNAAQTYGLPMALILAVMHAESAFDPGARSSAGAIGLMQVIPATGRRYGVHVGLHEPEVNVDVGSRYLRDLLAMFDGDKALALAAYNAGEGAVLRHGRRIPPFRETQAYVPRVLRLYAQYEAQASRRHGTAAHPGTAATTARP